MKLLKSKKIFVFITLIIMLLLTTITTSAATFYNDIKAEVATLVSKGDLPSFHNNLSGDTGYQTFYTKMVRTSNNINYFKAIEENELREIITWYHTEMNSVWEDVFNNLDVEPQYLEPNKLLGLYWDSKVEGNYSYLYLLWTSEYIPSEFINIKEITVNNSKYKLYDSEEDKKDFNANWLFNDYYHYAGHNLTIHKTPIAGFEKGITFGIPLTQKYKITSFTAGIDDAEYINDPDPNGIYEINVNNEIEFDLGKTPTRDGVKLCQLVTHGYEVISECEVQSYYDLAFGGYIHSVVFNTNIDIDRIYRVDVSYTLSSDNRDWYQFWLNVEDKDVKKSLTVERKSGGLFNLFKYQGFSEGSYKSNVKNSIEYDYRLHLNYDETGWNLFDEPPLNESKYKIVKNFKILRLNYLKDDLTYTVNVKMDTVDGKTLSIVDRDLILDTTTPTWTVKESVYDVIDNVHEKFGEAGNVLLSFAAIAIGLILVYIIFKIKNVTTKSLIGLVVMAIFGLLMMFTYNTKVSASSKIKLVNKINATNENSKSYELNGFLYTYDSYMNKFTASALTNASQVNAVVFYKNLNGKTVVYPSSISLDGYTHLEDVIVFYEQNFTNLFECKSIKNLYMANQNQISSDISGLKITNYHFVGVYKGIYTDLTTYSDNLTKFNNLDVTNCYYYSYNELFLKI